MTRSGLLLNGIAAGLAFAIGLIVAPFINAEDAQDAPAAKAEPLDPDKLATDLAICELRLTTATQEATVWHSAQEACDKQRDDLLQRYGNCVENLSTMLGIPQGTEAIP